MRKAWGIEKLVWATLDSFCDTGVEVLGRGTANREFFRALVRHSSFEEFHFFPGDLRDERTSRAAYEGLSSNGRAADRMRFIPRVRLPKALRETPYAAIHQSDPFTYFPSLLSLRNRHARSPLPVTAVTHSLSYQRFQNAYVQMVLAAASGRRNNRNVARTAAETIEATAENLGLPVRRSMSFAFARRGYELPGAARAGNHRASGWVSFFPSSFCLLEDGLVALLAFQRPPGARGCAAGPGRRERRTTLKRPAQAASWGRRSRASSGCFRTRSKASITRRTFYLAFDNPQETFGLTVMKRCRAVFVVASDFDGYRDLVVTMRWVFSCLSIGAGRGLATELPRRLRAGVPPPPSQESRSTWMVWAKR
jgi:hypothetical protein